MNKIEASLKQFEQAAERLSEVLSGEKNSIARDSAIKRFEFCFDLSWKTIKVFLREEKGLICSSPKDCFRQAFQNKLLDYDEIWLDMTNWRNLAVHTYSEELANDLFAKLPKTLGCFQALIKTLKRYEL